MNKKLLILSWVIGLSFLLINYVRADNHEEVARIQQQVIERIMSEDLADLNGIQKESIRKIITEEDPTLFNIERIDLDRNGVNEVIFTYVSGAHSSGAKVVRFNGNELQIIFQHGSTTSNTEFEVINNIPMLIFEESDYTPDYNSGKRFKEIYRWNGEIFANVKTGKIDLG